jgi:CheY-like chemotaxis protein
VQGARILLIEDDEALRELMERNLRARHHAVSVAVDAQSALRYLRTGTFDLIILDINLPDLSGWDVLRIARRESLGAGKPRIGASPIRPYAPQSPYVPQTDMQPEENLPIVVVSAVRVSPRRLSEFRPLAYLPKPFPMEALLRLAWEAAERRDVTLPSLKEEEYDELGTS